MNLLQLMFSLGFFLLVLYAFFSFSCLGSAENFAVLEMKLNYLWTRLKNRLESLYSPWLCMSVRYEHSFNCQIRNCDMDQWDGSSSNCDSGIVARQLLMLVPIKGTLNILKQATLSTMFQLTIP